MSERREVKAVPAWLDFDGPVVECRITSAAKPSKSPRRGWVLFHANCETYIAQRVLDSGVRKGEVRFIVQNAPPSKFEVVKWLVEDTSERMMIELLVKLPNAQP